MKREKLVNFLKKLIEETNTGKIKWFETSSEASFRIRIGDNLVRVSEKTYNPGGMLGVLGGTSKTYYSAVIIDKFGRVLDEVDSEETGQGWVYDLFSTARFSALNVSEIIDQMSADLEAGNVGNQNNEEQDDIAQE